MDGFSISWVLSDLRYLSTFYLYLYLYLAYLPTYLSWAGGYECDKRSWETAKGTGCS
jgi:hypothetical protein